MLIGVEGAQTPQKCYRIFFVRGRIQGSHSVSCGISGTGETPQEPWRRGERKAEATCTAPTSAGGPADEVIL